MSPYSTTLLLHHCTETLLYSTHLYYSTLLSSATQLYSLMARNTPKRSKQLHAQQPCILYYSTTFLYCNLLCSTLLSSTTLLSYSTTLLYLRAVKHKSGQRTSQQTRRPAPLLTILPSYSTLLYSTLHSTPPNSCLLYSTLLLYSTTLQLSYSAEPPSLSRTAGNTTQGPERACRHAVRGKEGHTPPRTISK